MNNLSDRLQTTAPQPDPAFAQNLEDRLVAELERLSATPTGEINMLARTTQLPGICPRLRREIASPLMLAAALLIVATAAWLVGPRRWHENGNIALGPVEQTETGYPVITPENVAYLKLVETLGNGGVYQAAYSPDGKTLALAGALGIWLYDAGDLDGQSRLLMDEEPATVVAFSPDGLLIASGHASGSVKLWDAHTGATVRTLDGHADRINALAFTPDGMLLASASGSGSETTENVVRLWNVDTGDELWADQKHSNPVWSVAFSADSLLMLADSGPQTHMVAGFAEGEPRTQIVERTQPQPGAPDALMLPDGVLVQNEGTDLHLYRLEQPAHATLALTDAAWMSDDGTITVVASDPQSRMIGHLTTLAADASGSTVVAGTTSGSVHRVDIMTREVTTMREADGAQVISIDVSSDGEVVAVLNTGEVSTYDLDDGEATGHLDGFDYVIASLAAYGDNNLLSTGVGSQVRLWDLNAGAQHTSIDAQVSGIHPIDISAGGDLVAYTGTNESGTMATRLHADASGEDAAADEALVHSLSVSPDGAWLAGVSNDHVAYLYSLIGPETEVRFGTDGERYLSTAFSSDGTRLALGREGGLDIYDMASEEGARVIEVAFERQSVGRLWYSPDGTMLLAVVYPSDAVRLGSSNTSLLLLDATTGELVRELVLPPSTAWQRTWQAAFSPDGALIAGLTSLTTGETRFDVWEVNTGERLDPPALSREDIATLTFNTTGNLLITGSWDGLIRLYAVSP